MSYNVCEDWPFWPKIRSRKLQRLDLPRILALTFVSGAMDSRQVLVLWPPAFRRSNASTTTSGVRLPPSSAELLRVSSEIQKSLD